MIVVGLLGLGVLLPGPVRAFGVRVDFHFMFVASALAMLGVQLVVLGLAAKAFARSELLLSDHWLAFLDRWFTLERGLLIGSGVLAAGLGVNAWILADWLRAGRGALFAVRPALVGLTLILVGAQLVFGSFFISVVRDDARA
jgi:hypothetical protein